MMKCPFRKKSLQQIVSLCMTMVMIISMVCGLTVSAHAANFNTGYSLSGSSAEKMVSIAKSQVGRTRSQMGYSDSWCARFVSDVASLAGESSAIPYNAGCRGLYNAIIKAGGKDVSSPQTGDIVFFVCNVCKVNGYDDAYSHVGIMLDNNGTCISGNYKGKVSEHSVYDYGDEPHWVSSGDVVLKYVRPNYNNSSTDTAPTVDLRVQYWVSEKGKGWNAEQATVATQFQTGKTYYCWYEIYDVISGKRLNDLFPSLDYTIQMTWSGPKGKIESCSYSNSDVNWFGIIVNDVGTYTCEIVVSGGVTGGDKTGFTVASGIRKPLVYMDKSSISLTAGETTTCTVGVIPYDAVTVNYGSENGNICEVGIGEITFSQELVSIPLKIIGLAPGKTNITLHFLNNSGNTLATSTIPVTVKSGINASTQDMPPVFIYGNGNSQSNESGQDAGTANVMGTAGTNAILTFDTQTGLNESTETATTSSRESSLLVTQSPVPATPPASNVSPNISNVSSNIQFSDVHKSDYFYDSVGWAVNNGITTGTTTTTFSPSTECTRAHFITFLWRAAGCPEPKSTVSLTDAGRNDYYYKAAVWALENGLISAYSDGGFHPNQPISRSDLVVVLWRYAGSPNVDAVTPFTDVKTNMPYAKAVKWAVDNNITTGTSSTTFSPNTICNRAQIVTFLYRFFE